jgi:hypothetical protein
MRHEWVDRLSELQSCREAVEWASDYESLEAAWVACERGDWMLCLLGRASGDRESPARRALVLCACACARTALPFVRAGETRPLVAIETAERWARGENGVTLDDVQRARRGAYAAADAVDYANAAACAAFAAADAAADDVAYAVYAVAHAHAAADARARALKSCADIVRQHYPTAPPIADTSHYDTPAQ